MRILSAQDGSGYSRNLFFDLQYAGLPDEVDVAMISVSEMWFLPEKDAKLHDPAFDNDTSEYFRQHSEQMDRNLAETKAILVEAKETLQSHFPK